MAALAVLGHFPQCHKDSSGLRTNSTYRRSSSMEDSASREKGIARQPASSSLAVTESQTTAAVCFSPRCHIGFRASLNTRLSEWKPAALSIVRASFKNSGHFEATPTRAPEGAGSH